jgi:hypothetical protein
MTNLRLLPPCALPCTARGCCSLAKATPPRGACGPTRTALQPPSLFNRSACTLTTATPPGLSARCCGLQHQQRAACPCAPALHPHPLCILPRTIFCHFQHGALAPLSHGCNTNAAPPPASPFPSAAHEALRRATTPRGWPRRRWIYFRKQTKCKKKACAVARWYSTGLRGA